VGPRRSLKLPIVCVAILLLVVLAVTRTAWLTALGNRLVHEDGPAKADLAVVLAGDKFGNRILKGADLVRRGCVPAVLVSGPILYGTYESDLAIAFAVSRGNPPQWFIPLPHQADSTAEESGQVLNYLMDHDVHSFLLVTSDYHTARSGRVFRAAIRRRNADVRMRVVAAPDRWFRPDSWWKTREGRKIFFQEWAKTAASAFGI
jgi:uncharacterized SAM-binding protein YcdF (DUF218 family)